MGGELVEAAAWTEDTHLDFNVARVGAVDASLSMPGMLNSRKGQTTKVCVARALDRCTQ